MTTLRDIVGHPGYLVGDDGTVWSTKLKGGNDRSPGRRGAPRRMATQVNASGYCMVNLDVNGTNQTRFVHHLVLEAFVGAKPAGLEACHYPDHDKANNRLENLRWDTHAENMRDECRDRPVSTVKTCRRCRVAKSVADFYADKRSSDGLKTECKRCHCDVSKATRDPEKKRSANREYARRVARGSAP